MGAHLVKKKELSKMKKKMKTSSDQAGLDGCPPGYEEGAEQDEEEEEDQLRPGWTGWVPTWWLAALVPPLAARLR